MVHEFQQDHDCGLFDDENTTSSGVTGSWWLEAIRVTDEVENKQKPSELSNPVNLQCHEFDSPNLTLLFWQEVSLVF